MFRFEELDVWKLAVEYGKDCYRITDIFPKHEQFSLSDQLRRAALSISNNIAEGSVGSVANFKKYINTAIASTLETVNILNFSYEVKYLDKGRRDEMYVKAEKSVRMLRNFSKSLNP